MKRSRRETGVGATVSAVSQELKSERRLIRGERSDLRGATPESARSACTGRRSRKRRSQEPVHPPTDPAAGAPPPGLRGPAGAPPTHHRVGGVGGGVRDAGHADSRHMEVIPGRAVVGGVGRGAGAPRLVPGEQQEVVQVDVSRLLEGVMFLGRNARRVALSATHHLESESVFTSQQTNRKCVMGRDVAQPYWMLLTRIQTGLRPNNEANSEADRKLKLLLLFLCLLKHGCRKVCQ